MTDILNALVVLANFVLVPGVAYGSQLALGAVGITLVYSVLRFSNFAHGNISSIPILHKRKANQPCPRFFLRP